MPVGPPCVDVVVFHSTPESLQCLLLPGKYEQACSENICSLSPKTHNPVSSLASKFGKPPGEGFSRRRLMTSWNHLKQVQ